MTLVQSSPPSSFPSYAEPHQPSHPQHTVELAPTVPRPPPPAVHPQSVTQLPSGPNKKKSIHKIPRVPVIRSEASLKRDRAMAANMFAGASSRQGSRPLPTPERPLAVETSSVADGHTVESVGDDSDVGPHLATHSLPTSPTVFSHEAAQNDSPPALAQMVAESPRETTPERSIRLFGNNEAVVALFSKASPLDAPESLAFNDDSHVERRSNTYDPASSAGPPSTVPRHFFARRSSSQPVASASSSATPAERPLPSIPPSSAPEGTLNEDAYTFKASLFASLDANEAKGRSSLLGQPSSSPLPGGIPVDEAGAADSPAAEGKPPARLPSAPRSTDIRDPSEDATGKPSGWKRVRGLLVAGKFWGRRRAAGDESSETSIDVPEKPTHRFSLPTLITHLPSPSSLFRRSSSSTSPFSPRPSKSISGRHRDRDPATLLTPYPHLRPPATTANASSSTAIVSRPASMVSFSLPAPTDHQIAREAAASAREEAEAEKKRKWGEGLTEEQRERLGKGYVTHGEMAREMERRKREGEEDAGGNFWLV